MTEDAEKKVPDWPTERDPCGQLHRPITEDWLREHGFRIEDNRNDNRLPVRRLHCRWDGVDGRQMFSSPDDLCIDVAPQYADLSVWHVWLMQVEPYRHIHIRPMKFTWEIARLYEGLTGRVWPGVL